MEYKSGQLDGVKVIQLDSFEDHRGDYVETYNQKSYKENGIEMDFIQDDYSMSRNNVLRGIHGDDQTWKLITCLQGSFYFVVVDFRKESPTFCQWESFTLSDKNHLQVLVPPSFGNGHLILSPQAIFHYKQTSYYPTKQFSLRWNDPKLDIWWPTTNPIVSQRDENAGLLNLKSKD